MGMASWRVSTMMIEGYSEEVFVEIGNGPALYIIPAEYLDPGQETSCHETTPRR